MKMKSLTVLFSLLLGSISCKHGHHPVPTYFGKLHDNGTMVDRSHPEYDSFITSRPIINTISRNDASTIKLRVWPDTVKNGEKVKVKNRFLFSIFVRFSWQPLIWCDVLKWYQIDGFGDIEGVRGTGTHYEKLKLLTSQYYEFAWLNIWRQICPTSNASLTLWKNRLALPLSL